MTRFGVCLALGSSLLLGAAPSAAACTDTPHDYTWPSHDCFQGLQACIDSEPCNGGVIEIATNQPITDAIHFEKGLTLRPSAGYTPVFLAPLSAATPTDSNKAGYYIRIEGLTFQDNGRIHVTQQSPSGLDVEVVDNAVANAAPQVGWRGIELNSGTGGTGTVGFVVSGNRVTIEGDSSETGIGTSALPDGSYGSIDNNSIAMSHNQGGGGIFVGKYVPGPWTVDVVANRISGTGYAFGVYLSSFQDHLAARLLDNLIVGQMGAGVGFGAVYLDASFAQGAIDATIVDNTIAGNQTGISAFPENQGSVLSGVVADNIVSGNSVLGVDIEGTSLANRNNLVFANGANHFSPGPGTTAEDPRFVGNGDYHLQPGSPAIDAGDDGAVPGDLARDLDGNPRIHGSHVDLGAYEVPEPTTLLSGGATLLALHALGRRPHARTASC